MGGLGGAIAAGAVSAALYLGALAWPAAAPLTALFVSLPGMYLAIRSSPNAALVWLVAAALIVAVFSQAAIAIGFIVPFGLTAWTVGWAYRRGAGFPGVAASGVGAWTGGILVALFVAGDMATTTTAIREHLIQVFQNADVDAAAGGSSALTEQIEELAATVTALFPAIIALSGIAVVLIDLAILRRIAGVMTESELKHWRSPDGLVWILIGSGFAAMFAPGAVRLLALNLLVLVAIVYFLQGLSVVAFFLDRMRFPPALRPLLFFFLIVQYVLALCVTLVGLVDLWADLRRLRPRPADAGAE